MTRDDWIKCADRMPEPGVPVLITFKNEFGKMRTLRAEWSDGKSREISYDAEIDDAIYDEETDTYWCPEGWFESNEYEEVHWAVVGVVVTHWMPLPEPPDDEVTK
jgi:hypothetical protein